MNKKKQNKLLEKMNSTSTQLNLLVIQRAEQINSKGLYRSDKKVVAGAECGKTKEHGASGYVKRKHILQPTLSNYYKSKLGVNEGEKSSLAIYPVGNCAECEAVNKVLSKNNKIDINNISVSLAVGCRKFDIIPACGNCNALFF